MSVIKLGLDPDPVLDRHQNRSRFRIRVGINTMAIHNTRMYYFQILGDHCDEVWYCKVSSIYSLVKFQCQLYFSFGKINLICGMTSQFATEMHR
jgi:hypothetical protein